jgi:hypothetical protein
MHVEGLVLPGLLMLQAAATALELVLPHDGHHSVTLLPPNPVAARELPLPLHYCLRNSISFYYLVEAVPIRASYLRSDGDLALIYLILYVLK